MACNFWQASWPKTLFIVLLRAALHRGQHRLTHVGDYDEAAPDGLNLELFGGVLAKALDEELEGFPCRCVVGAREACP